MNLDLEKHRDSNEKLKECTYLDCQGTTIFSADEFYTEEEKRYMLKNDISLDFSLEFCNRCDGVCGMIG
jgi:hypothetical protein